MHNFINGKFGRKKLNEPYRSLWTINITILLIFIGMMVLFMFIQFFSWLTSLINYVVWS